MCGMDWLRSDPGQSGAGERKEGRFETPGDSRPPDSVTECVLAVTRVKKGASRKRVIPLDPELVWEGGWGVK